MRAHGFTDDCLSTSLTKVFWQWLFLCLIYNTAVKRSGSHFESWRNLVLAQVYAHHNSDAKKALVLPYVERFSQMFKLIPPKVFLA